MSRTKQLELTGSTLKIIAMLTMLIDHMASTIVYGMANSCVYTDPVRYDKLILLYQIMRCIGRLAFPIFCFLMVEGIHYTSNKGKYALRMLLFAFISELPFDLAIQGGRPTWSGQNVYFTLLIGLLVLIAWENLRGRTTIGDRYSVRWWIMIAAGAVCLGAGCAMAWLLHTDYGMVGVLAIAVIYLIRSTDSRPWMQRPNSNASLAMTLGVLALTMISFTEAFAFIDAFFVSLYHGRRGWKLKYVFYAFYPLHLLILYLIARAAGWLV